MKELTLEYNFIKSTSEEKNIVILLHGYGADKEDMSTLPSLFKKSQNTSFYIPNAPFSCDHGFGKAWFPLVFLENDISIKNSDDLILANQYLSSFIENIIKIHKTSSKNIGVLGFSQGGVMALFNAIYGKLNYGSVICHSGLFYEAKQYPINQKQEILLVHGKEDEVVSFNNIVTTEKILLNYGINIETYYKESLGHHIDTDTIEKSEAFLLKNFK